MEDCKVPLGNCDICGAKVYMGVNSGELLYSCDCDHAGPNKFCDTFNRTDDCEKE